MSQETNSPGQLSQFSGELDKALGRARTGAIAMLVLSVGSLGLIGFWLNKAHEQFTTTLTPEYGANYAVAEVQKVVPTYVPELRQRLIEHAPALLDRAEARLNQIPDEFADSLIKQTGDELEKLMPQVETELHKSLSLALSKARDARGPGVSDEAHIKAIIDDLGDTYAAESIKLIDDLRARYTKRGADVLAYLDYLAENKGLDRKESLQRQALVTFLTIASRAKSTGA